MSAFRYSPDLRPALSNAEGEAWRALIESRCGIHFSEARTHQLAGALRQRMQYLGISEYSEYLSMVTSSRRGEVEWAALLEAVTNHETCFFRHAPTFRALEEDLLPSIVKRTGGAAVSLWSAGCSTGEEAYSAAMVCHRLFQTVPMRCSIEASDLSEQAVETAAGACYGSKAAAGLPRKYRPFLVALPLRQGFQVAAPVRKLVHFSRVNLTQSSSYPAEPFDVILCQNVLVYFRAGVQQRVLGHLASRLKPGGFLLPGPGEIAGLQCAELRCVRMGEMQVFLKQ